MRYLKNARSLLLMVLVVCVCVKLVFWALWPIIVALIPYLIIGVILVTVIGLAIFRTTRL